MRKLELFIVYQVLLAFIVVYEAESQLVNITSQPPNALSVLEGQPLTLEWTFIVKRTFGRVQFGFSGADLARIEASPGSTSVIRGIFRGRASASTTETNATITFSSLIRTDTASYVFIVTDDDNGVARAPLQLVVLYPPSLTRRAPDQVVLEGDPAITLTCSADGEPAPNITWTKVFTNGSDSDVLFTGEQFILPSNRTSDGTYRCNASNGIGSDVNHTVDVTVNFKPERFVFMVKRSNENFCKGGIINITCSAVGKPPVHTYQLFKDGTPVHTSNNSVLFWSQQATAGGEIVYSCVANNTVATASTTKNITVNEGSAIKHLENVTAVEGRNATLNCTVTGIPMPSVSWLEVKTGNRSSENPLVFTNVSRKQAGEYICEATNSCGNDSKTVILSVNYPPEGVQLEVSENTVCKGASVIFNCSVTDANPMELTYHLYENNVMVSNSSSTGIWNRTMTTRGGFVYSCKVTNIVGTKMGSNVSVTVNERSAIEQLENVTVLEGRNATLNCTVAGIPTPSVSWFEVKTGIHSFENPFVFANVSRKQAGKYICEATNPCGNDSKEGILIVNYPPEGVQLEVSEETVCKGASIIFNCSVTDANPMELTYHLYENNVMISNSSSTGIWNRSMTTGGVFVYSCNITNIIGTAMSTNVSVTVNVLPSILPIDNETVIEGGNVTLTCNASGFPAPTVYWVKTSNRDRFNVTGLVFTSINRSEAGEYTCVASNLCTSTEVVEVDVLFPPEIVKLVPSKTTVCQREIIIFNCSAHSNPAVHTYQWYVNGIMVNEVSSTGVWNRTMTTGGVFVYKCKVNNSIGAVMSENVTITVNEPATIEKVEKSTVAEGGYLTLSCQVSGDPFPSVSWVKVMGGERFNGSNLSLRNVNGNASGEYRCEAANLCSSVSSVSSVTVVDAPKITHISAPHILSTGEVLTLNCTADGNPEPNITWTRLPNGETVNMPLTVTGKKYVEDYRCTASNGIGTVSKDTSVTRGYCEETCEGGRTCRVGLCRCTDGKTGDTCEITEQPKKRVVVGIEFTMTFKAVYSDLENPETKKLIEQIEVTVKVELSGTGVTQVRVASLKEGSVIADLELTFNSSTYEDYLRGRLQDATKDNKLGDLDVKQVVVGRFISPDEPEQTCSPFFEGKDCTRAAGTLIALIVVGVILAVALLIGLVICCFHKKNASGRGSFQNVKVTQRQDPEGNNSLARDYVEPGGSRETLHGNVNTGYDPERPPESTQMATFSSNNGRVEGIHLKDSRSQKAQPGEGTYADLGDFQAKRTAPATLPPIKKPPTYEETNYAEITQFLKAPVAPQQDESPQEESALLEAPVEEPDENAKDDAWNNLNNDSAALSRDTKEETNTDKLYPSLELVKSENKTEQIVVSI